MLAKTSVNWVKSLPKYAQILNNDPKRILGYKSPFQVFFGRDNHLVTEMMDRQNEACCPEEDIHAGSLAPKPGDYTESLKQMKSIRSVAAKATEKNNEYMVKRQQRANPPPKFRKGMDVLLKLPLKAGTKPTETPYSGRLHLTSEGKK